MTIPVGPRNAARATSSPLPSRASLYGRANAVVLLWFVAAAITALIHRNIPAAGWLMVHLLLLGGVSTAILLWSQHFAETLLRQPAPGGVRWLWIRLLGWSGGVALVAAGMVTETGPLVDAGATVCAAIAVVHLVILIRQARAGSRGFANRYAHLVRYYLLATAMLPIGVGFGVVLARVDTTPGLAGRLYLAHVLTTLLGWIGMTVAGTIVLLWPTVLHTKISEQADRAGRRALWVLAGGIAIDGVAIAVGLQWLVLVGAVVLAVGIVMLGVNAWEQAVVASQAAKSGTGGGFAAWSIAASLVWFLISVLASGVTVAFADSWVTMPTTLGGLVSPFAIGFTAQIVLGSMTYLLPVVLGGGPRALRWSQRELSRWGAARLVVLNACVALFALPLPSWVAVSVSSLGLGSLLVFLVLAVRTLVIQRVKSPRTLAAPAAMNDGGGTALSATAQSAATSAGNAPGVAAADGGAAPAAATTSPPPRPRHGRGAAIGAGLVVLAVALGVAADPVAAGAAWFPAGTSSGGGGDVAATGETTTVTVRMEGMRFYPDVIEVPAGNELVIELINDGDQVHDLVVANGADSGRLFPGESATVEVGLITESLPGWCSVAGHRLMGMTLEIVVVGEGQVAADPGTGATPGSSGSDDDMAGMSGMDHGSMMGSSTDGDSGTTGAASAAEDLDLFADKPEDFEARDATLPPAPTSGTNDQGVTSSPDPDGEGTLHEVTFTVGEALAEVSVGVEQTRWTFNGTAPGPTLRGKVGDTFVITLYNDGTIGHSIDFHAGALSPDEPMRTINPGETLTYTFRAERSGIWMYHCGTMPLSMHISNGMFGAVIIDPPDLAEVDREYLLVQSELYLGPQDETADPERIATQNPDLVVFNGYANQYRYSPLVAKTGETVRFWVLDVGPNRPSSFHIVGGQFDTVFFEGDYLLKDGGSTGTGGSQALGLQSAQGGFVELVFPEAGHYTALTHIMSDAEKGATAIVEVTD